MKQQHLLALAAALACASAAQAEINYAVVQFSPFTITATDLSPFDGVAPEFAFVSAPKINYLNFRLDDASKFTANASDTLSKDGEQLWGAFLPTGIALAHTGLGQPSMQTASVDGWAQVDIGVSAHTQITLSGLLQMAAAAACSPTGNEFCGANASFSMSFSTPTGMDYQWGSSYDRRLEQSVDVTTAGLVRPPNVYSGLAEITFENPTDAPLITTLRFNGGVEGRNRSMLPEPSTWGLVLVGLGCVLVSKRRRIATL